MKTVTIHNIKMCDQDCDQEAVHFGLGFQLCKVHALEFEQELERDKQYEYELDARLERDEMIAKGELDPDSY